MFKHKSIAAGVLASSLILSATPSFAGNIIAEIAVRALARGIADGLGSAIANGAPTTFTPGPAYASAPVFAPAQDYLAASWYRNWLAARQNGSSAALYNHPCTMSDGQREMAVPCQMVAMAISGPSASPAEPAVVGDTDAAPPNIYYSPPARAHHIHRSTFHASDHARVAYHAAHFHLR
jgi:hypothetical protein